MEWYHVERSYGTTEEIIISYSFETFYSYVEWLVIVANIEYRWIIEIYINLYINLIISHVLSISSFTNLLCQ